MGGAHESSSERLRKRSAAHYHDGPKEMSVPAETNEELVKIAQVARAFARGARENKPGWTTRSRERKRAK